MKATLIFPIATLHGKLNQSSKFYFRCVKGNVYAQRCPTYNKPLTEAQIRAANLFAKRARMVAQMQREGSRLTLKQLWELAKQIV